VRHDRRWRIGDEPLDALFERVRDAGEFKRRRTARSVFDLGECGTVETDG
jgi:hypothetical protein